MEHEELTGYPMDGQEQEVIITEAVLPVIRDVIDYDYFMSLSPAKQEDYLKQTRSIGYFTDTFVNGRMYTDYSSNNECYIMAKSSYGLHKHALIRKDSSETFYETNVILK